MLLKSGDAPQEFFDWHISTVRHAADEPHRTAFISA